MPTLREELDKLNRPRTGTLRDQINDLRGMAATLPALKAMIEFIDAADETLAAIDDDYVGNGHMARRTRALLDQQIE
jgi:hypothetical protein